MFPVICKIGPLSIYSYGVMLALAVIICSFLLAKDAQRLGIAKETIHDLVFWVVVSGIIGARIFYILLNLDLFIKDPLEIIMIQHGGLAWQGSLILGTLGGLFFIKIKKLLLWQTLDLVAPYIALGQSIGRIGCFLNGCCFGKEISWGIYSPVHDAHLHPTQLYCSLGLFLIFLFLKKYQKTVKVVGKVFVVYLLLAALLRFSVEFFRADHDIVVFGLSIFQIICIVIFLSGLYVNSLINRHSRRN